VRESRLRDLWLDSPARKEAARTAEAANDRMVEAGGALAAFPFCPALALQRTGDPLGVADDHREQAHAAERIRLARR
jgi:hypothetical protein